MSVVVRFPDSNVTKQQYDSVRSALEDSGEWPPRGCRLHVRFGDEQDIRVSEVWESQEQLDACGEKLRPRLEAAGIELAGRRRSTRPMSSRRPGPQAGSSSSPATGGRGSIERGTCTRGFLTCADLMERITRVPQPEGASHVNSPLRSSSRLSGRGRPCGPPRRSPRARAEGSCRSPANAGRRSSGRRRPPRRRGLPRSTPC